MSNNIFRIFNPKGSTEDPKERRRGQLRRAQQAHRDRRDQYTKSLEQELGRTRASEANLVRQAESLRATVEMLCSRIGIEAPVELQIDGFHHTPGSSHQDITHSAGTSPLSSTGRGRKVKAQQSTGTSWMSFDGSTQPPPSSTSPWTSPASSSDYPGSLNEWPVSNQQQYQSPSPLQNSSLGQVKSPERSVEGSLCLKDLDEVTVGMEFVLSLEEPCLGHIHGDPSKPNEPSGHALTTTAHLFSACPSHNYSPNSNNKPQAPSYTEAPKATLERLLTLSPDVVVNADVITPVQAWNHIRSRPFFGGLDIPSLRNLAGKLRDAVKCHGFGAVVQQPVFERLVLETLILGREF